MTVEQRIGEEEDQFPIGMRILAVDDDPTCLLILETLLRRCQYKVTTTSQAITALRLLRESKDNFDLVISDVHMPDMDGFKLLEYVGLEMDLPVIMLSAHSDPKLVMKGITHGACDYLVKPVRIEELKNIWQHVIRRRSDKKDRNGGKVRHGNDEGTTDNKPNKKRKDQKEDEEEDCDEDRCENEDPMTQKKPRVVWSVDLHGKFVAAVNQLGIDKAVPKKILDLMNVDKLTRENVASHLQKYRLFLKKYSAVANQQAFADVSHLHMGSVSGFGPQHMVGPAHFQNAAFRSLPTGRMLERLNSPSSLGINGLPSPGVPHLNHIQAPSHLTNSHSYFQPNILQGMPISVELDANMHHGATQSREVPNGVDSRTAFPVSNGFSGEKLIVGTTNNPFLGISNKPMTQEPHPQGITLDPKIEMQCRTMASMDSGFSPHYPYCGRWSDGLPVSVQSTGIQSNSFAFSDSFEKTALLPGDIGQSMSTMALQKTNVPSNITPIATLPLQLQDSKVDLPCQVDSIGGNAAQVMNYAPQDSHKVDSSYHANAGHSSTSSAIPVNQTGTPLVQSLRPNEVIFHKTGSLNSVGQSILVESSSLNHNDIGNLALDTPVRSKDGYMIGQQSLPGTYNSTNFGSLEDFVSAMVKHD